MDPNKVLMLLGIQHRHLCRSNIEKQHKSSLYYEETNFPFKIRKEPSKSTVWPPTFEDALL